MATDHTHDEIALSAQWAESLFEGMFAGCAFHEVIFGSDGEARDYVFLRVNPAFEVTTGLRADDIIGRTVRDVITGIEEEWIACAGRVVRSGNPETFEHCSAPLGKHYHATFVPIGGNQFAATFVDVSERVALLESQRRQVELQGLRAELASKLLSGGYSVEEMSSLVLEKAKQATGAMHGYVGVIAPDSGALTIEMFTPMFGDQSNANEHDRKVEFPRGADGTYPALWGNSLNTGEPEIANNPAAHPRSTGIPAGHAPLENFLAVPSRIDGEVVGQIALANCPGGFTEEHLRAVEQIAGIWAIKVQRIRAEQTLANERDRFRRLFEDSRNCIAVYEAVDGGDDFVFVNFNRAAERTEGILRSRVMGRRVTKVFPGVEPSGILGLLQRVYRTGESEFFGPVEYSDDRLGGWRECHAYKLPATGEVVCVYEDVSARRNSERSVIRHARLLSAVLDATPEAILMFRRDGLIELANDAAAKRHNLTFEQYIGRNIYDFLSPELAEARRAEVDAVFESGRPHDFIDERDGYHIHHRLYPMSDGGEGVDRIVSYAGDVSASVGAQRALAASEEKFRRLAELSADLILKLLPDHRIVYASPASNTILGRQPESLEGSPYESLVHPSEREVVRSLLDSADISSLPRNVSHRMLKSNGEYAWVELAARRFEAASEGGDLHVSVRDITDRRRVEQQLQHSQKMDAVGRLAGGVAHDFNNLLTVILGNAELVEAFGQMDERSANSIGEIIKAGRKAADLTGRLLAFSRNADIAPRPIDLGRSILDLEKIVRRLVGEDVECVVQCPAEPLQVVFDPSHLDQVMLNLAANARDAMPEGGTFHIELDVMQIGDDFTDGGPDLPPGDYAAIVVSDTGIGMDEETRSRIFEPFFSTKGERGTGLGLATTHGIIAQHRGAIRVYSVPGQGTSFRIFIPLLTDEAVEVPRDRGEEPESVEGTETILIVEDVETILGMVSKALEEAGYTVYTARTAEGALKILDECEEGVDLLFTDVVLPECSGPDLAKRAWKRNKAKRFMFTSGYAGDMIRRRGVAYNGVHPFLRKPYGMRQLLVEIRRALNAPSPV